jgi:predicted  nucleic acid-binding Zn-ribbon protein
MKASQIVACTVGLMLLGLAGCGGSKQEKAQNKMVSATDEMADVLASIKSNADLASAKPRLAKAVAKMNEAMTEAMSLPPDQQKAPDSKMEAAMNRTDQRVQKEIERLERAGVAIGAVFSSIGAPVGMFR